MTDLPALPTPSRNPLSMRSPAVWIGAAALALCGVAAASYLAGRAAQPVEPAPTAAVIDTPAKEGPSAHDTRAKAVCADCGVVDSVQAVTHKGEGSGVGAVAGGVVGGLLGNQMGAGQGKTAMTVLGAVGGGFAGNEVEKRARATTVYKVRVRTDEGQLRTFEQSSAPAVGQRVRIEGHKLRLLPAAG